MEVLLLLVSINWECIIPIIEFSALQKVVNTYVKLTTNKKFKQKLNKTTKSTLFLPKFSTSIIFKNYQKNSTSYLPTS